MNDETKASVEEASLSPTGETGPGRRLAATRQAQGLDRDEVAARLRLHPKLMSALEADEYDKLPPAAFVVGYLRSYARLLGIPEEEIIQSFERRGTVPPPLVVRAKPEKGHSNDARIRWLTYGLIGVLVVLLVVWWLAQAPSGEETAAPAESGAPADDSALPLPPPPGPAPLPGTVPPANPGGEGVVPPEAAPPATPGTSQPPAAPANPPASGAMAPGSIPVGSGGSLPAAGANSAMAVNQTPPTSVPPQPRKVVPVPVLASAQPPVAGGVPAVQGQVQPAQGQPQATLRPGSVASLPGQPPVVAPAASVPPAQPGGTVARAPVTSPLPGQLTPAVPAQGGVAAQPVAPAAGGGGLALVFDRESWTDVRDATGRSLAHNLMKPGSSLQLAGTPPYFVFLGNAPGVKVSVNGTPADHTRFQSNNVARFMVRRDGTLGPVPLPKPPAPAAAAEGAPAAGSAPAASTPAPAATPVATPNSTTKNDKKNSNAPTPAD